MKLSSQYPEAVEETGLSLVGGRSSLAEEVLMEGMEDMGAP